jgi:hypothetical protein
MLNEPKKMMSNIEIHFKYIRKFIYTLEIYKLSKTNINSTEIT